MHVIHGTWIPDDTQEFTRRGAFYLWVETDTLTGKPRSRADGKGALLAWMDVILLSGGANRDRTDDLKLAKLALSQLSYGPIGLLLGHSRRVACRAEAMRQPARLRPSGCGAAAFAALRVAKAGGPGKT